ncbi:hypothetical protein G9A89_012265 [Geosiphon pyriformis]|nr:hypothetical protein G9A89_012265 [Geosiphon pyriformis]
MNTTPVLRGINLHWSCLSFSKCAKYKNMSHISLGCFIDENISSGRSPCKMFLDIDKSRLATIYVKCLAPVAHFVTFGKVPWAKIADRSSFPFFSEHSSLVDSGSFSEIKSILSVMIDIKKRFAVLKSSFTSLMEQISELAKRLDLLVLAISHDVVMRKGSGGTTGGKTAANLESSVFSEVKRLENMLEELSVSVLSLTIATCNIRDINNLTKQEDIVYWHKNINNLIVDKFSGVYVFTLGMNSGYLNLGVAIVIDNSLAKYIFKISEVLAKKINSFIAKAVSKFSFIVLSGDFNEDGSYRCASYKKCLDLGLVNSLDEGSIAKMLIQCNSCGVTRVINYLFMSSNLVNSIVNHDVTDVVDYFNTNYKAIAVSMGLSGLLDCEFKDIMAANIIMFLNEFARTKSFSDLNAMWVVVHKIMVFSANGTFRKKWFKSFNGVFTKVSSRFYKLELLVSKLVKTSHLASSKNFALLLETWDRLNNSGVAKVKSLFLSGYSFDVIYSELAKARKSYCSSKLLKSKHAEKSHIRQAICKRMKNFELDKDYIIRSVLEHLFCKVVLDYLVVGNKLVLKPRLVKFKYVFDKAFSGVMCLIGFNKLYGMVFNLPDSKAAGLSVVHLSLSLKRYGIAFMDQLCDCHSVVFDWYTFKRWKRLDPYGLIPKWFRLSFAFLNNMNLSLVLHLASNGVGLLNILDLSSFVSAYTVGCKAGAAVFFKDINLGLGIGILDLILSILAKMQAIALALECVLLSSSVHLFLDSQSALDACKHFVHDVYYSVCRAHWEVGSGSKFLDCSLLSKINWHCSLFV